MKRHIFGLFRGDARRGVALLIVVGLLALLLISAVAFSILMRVERSGASNFHHATAARQMLYTALARAIEDINTRVDEDPYPDWTNEVLVSTHSSSDPARVLSDRAMWFVPQAMRQAVETAQPFWVPVIVGAEGGAGELSVGRYAYVVANASGLLDAQVVFDPATNRWMGASPGEIRLVPNAQIDVISTNDFVQDRISAGRYVTLDELTTLGTNGIDAPVMSNFEVFSYAPDELQTNNLTPKIDISTLDRITSQRTAISNAFVACGMTAKQAHWAYLGLVDYVDEDSIPAGDSDVDKFARPLTEAAPTLGQIVVLAQYARTPVPPALTSYVHRITYGFAFPLNFPFMGVGATAFKVEAKLDASGANVGAWNGLAPRVFTFTTNITVSSTTSITPIQYMETSTITNGTAAPPTVPPTYIAARFTFKVMDSSDNVIYQVPVPTLGSGIMLTFDFPPPTTPPSMPPTYQYWTEAIDPRYSWLSTKDYWLPSTNAASRNTVDQLCRVSTQPGCGGYLYTCNGQGVGSLAKFLLRTPTALSQSTSFRMNVDGVRDGTSAASCDPLNAQNRAYVANRSLQSVGELGYLPIARWLTITLYDHEHANIYPFTIDGGGTLLPPHGYHRVLDYFTLNTTNAVLRGRVNVNSRQTNVLAAVFQDLPLRTEEQDTVTRIRNRLHPSTSPSQFDDATDLANLVRQNGPYSRLSDLGKIWKGVAKLGVYTNYAANLTDTDPVRVLAEPCDVATTGIAGFGEFEREAVIRNSCNLLTTRQQIFTIMMRADSFTPKFGFTDIHKGNVLATAHAVAQVWRDPVATDCGNGVMKHKCYVQLFKLLDE